MAVKATSPRPHVGVQTTAFMTAAFLSGAMASLSAVMIPVLLDTNLESQYLLQQWARLYHYGHMIMPALSVSATGLYVYVALRKHASKDIRWIRYATAAATTISMVPFTWFIMTPTNDTLFELKDATSPVINASVDELKTVRELIVRWAWLHAMRSLFPLIGGVLGLVTVLLEVGM